MTQDGSFTIAQGKYEARATYNETTGRYWARVVYLSDDPVHPFGEISCGGKYFNTRGGAERAMQRWLQETK